MLDMELSKHPGFIPFLMFRWGRMCKAGKGMTVQCGDHGIKRTVRSMSATDGAVYMARLYGNHSEMLRKACGSTLESVDRNGMIGQFCMKVLGIQCPT